jgi:flagellar protein FlaJ
MSLVDLVPLVLVVAAAVAWLGPSVSGRVERVVARIARSLFGRFVSGSVERERIIGAAYIDSTVRTYTATTYLYAVLALFGGGLAGAYVVAGVLLVLEPVVHALSGLPSTISTAFGFTPDFRLVLSDSLYWGLLVGGGVVSGLTLSGLSYTLRWQLPKSHAEVRRRSIDEGLPRIAAIMYALSRGGVALPEMLGILARNSDIYGESAREAKVAVREIELLGQDVITALGRVARRTPSEQFKTFSENLASVLQSGSDISTFLRDQYERFQENAEERQAKVLEFLATIAEAYVTVLVAGVLFLMTILLVFGLTTTDTLPFLRMMAYIIIPLGNAAFAVYLGQKLESLGVARLSGGDVLERLDVRTPARPAPNSETRRPDGGVGRDAGRELDNESQLKWYDHLARVKRLFRDPLRAVLESPETVLYAAVPVAVLVFAVRLPAALTGVGVTVRVLDDLLVQSTLFVFVTYAVARTLYKRRIDRIEAVVPDLLERLASLNESGMTLVDSLDRVRGSDLGVLTPEVGRIWRDIEFGSTVDDALVRFGRRVRTTAVTRVVVLLTNAMRASGNLGPVLRIAAEQVRADLALRRRRRRQMFTYLVVIYISFLVFLVITLAVNEVLVPSLPESVATPSAAETRGFGVNANQFARFGNVNKAAYTLVFFHTALIQAVCSGLIAGQLGNGSLRDGLKHAAAMLAIAYLVFVLISAPVASVSAGQATATDDAIVVDSVSTSDGGFVVAWTDGVNSTAVGRTGYIEPGTQRDVVVPLDGQLPGDEVTLVAHRDTNGDGVYEFEEPYLPGTSQVDRPYTGLADDSSPGVAVELNRSGAGG